MANVSASEGFYEECRHGGGRRRAGQPRRGAIRKTLDAMHTIAIAVAHRITPANLFDCCDLVVVMKRLWNTPKLAVQTFTHT